MHDVVLVRWRGLELNFDFLLDLFLSVGSFGRRLHLKIYDQVSRHEADFLNSGSVIDTGANTSAYPFIITASEPTFDHATGGTAITILCVAIIALSVYLLPIPADLLAFPNLVLLVSLITLSATVF